MGNAHVVYQLNKTNIGGGEITEKVIDIFDKIQNDFSVSEVFNIIYRSIAYTAKKYLENKYMSKDKVVEFAVNYCRLTAERIMNDNWSVSSYSRPYALPQSELSSYFFNSVTKLGTDGFTWVPSKLILKEALIRNNIRLSTENEVKEDSEQVE